MSRGQSQVRLNISPPCRSRAANTELINHDPDVQSRVTDWHFGPEDRTAFTPGRLEIMQPRFHTHSSPSLKFRRPAGIALLLALIMPGLLLAAWRSAEAARSTSLKTGTTFSASTAMLPVAPQISEPVIGPGLPQVGSNATRSNASSTKAGSVLFFHRYTSNSQQANTINTLLTITNTNPLDGINVRLFFADINGCFTSERDFALTANQTRTFVASELAPDMSGYAVAVAIDPRGVPTQFNWLIGTAAISDSLGHEASYNAFSVAKRSAGSVRTIDSPATVNLTFDNAEYDRLPKNVAVDNVQVQSGQFPHFTDLALYSPAGNLITGGSAAKQINAVAYEQNGTAHLKTIEAGCGIAQRITDIWPEMNTFITEDKPAWANFSATDLVTGTAVPVLGMSLTDREGIPQHNARNMQVLSWLDSYQITFPIIVPLSPSTDVNTAPQLESTVTGASESKPGSVLLYSNFASGDWGNSQINITNTNKVEKTNVRVFFVGLNPVGDPAAVPVPAEQLITLFPTQTMTINAQDIAPNQRGWVIAIAIDNSALPRQFNYLIGSALVNEATGQSAAFNAIGIEKYSEGSVPRNPDVETADVIFNDVDYDRLPATVATTGIPPQEEVTTLLGFRRPSDDLMTPPSTRGSGNLLLIDDLLGFVSAVMGPYQTNLSAVKSLSPSAPITRNLTPGHRGWLKLQSATPIFAWFSNLAAVHFNLPATGSWAGGHSGGANLFIMTTADTQQLRVFSINASSKPPTAVAETLNFLIEQRRQDGTIVRLDGRSSFDEDNPTANLKYAWYVDDQLVSTKKVGDYKLSRGFHSVSLIVTDEDGIPSEPNEQLVEVRDTTPPVISGIPSAITRTVSSTSAGSFITFPLPVAWDAVDGLSRVTSSKASGSPFLVGRTTVTFTAQDNSGNVATATMTVTIQRSSTIGTLPQQGGVPGDIAPKMANIYDQYIPAGTSRDLILQAEDDDGDPVMFDIVGAPAWAQIVDVNPVGRTAVLRIAPPAGATGGTTNVRVVAFDGRGFSVETVPFRMLIDAVPNDDTGSGGGIGGDDGGGTGGGGGGTGGGTGNNPPTARAKQITTPTKATSKLGALIQLDGSTSSDPDPDDRLTYEWRDGETVIAQGALTEVWLKPGLHSITLKVADGRGGVSTTDPQVVEIQPRDLTVEGVSPSTQRRSLSQKITITGTGFNDGTTVDITCICAGGSGIKIKSYDLIEEDTIIITIDSSKADMGWKDMIVRNPDGTFVKRTRAIGITN